MGKNVDKMRLHSYFIKNYKKNTLAIFFSFVLTFILLTTMLVLLHTNHKIANIQLKTEFTPSDVYFDNLSQQQVEVLQKDPDIRWTALQQGEIKIYTRNQKSIFLIKHDAAAMTMMSKLEEGRLPQKPGEVTAERWVLLNLGIEPAVGTHIRIADSETSQEEEFRLVGILSDIYGNKRYGALDLYTGMKKESTEPYLVYLKFQDSVDYHEKISSLKTELGLSKKQIKDCPARENPGELYNMEWKVISILLFICLVVFYGVYRIAIISRMQQYGILRGIGLTKGQLHLILLKELYCIYSVGAPVGIALGLLAAYIIMLLSGDRNTTVYLLNEQIQFHMVIPAGMIVFCLLITFILIGIVGYLTGRTVTKSSVTATIAEKTKEHSKSFFQIQQGKSKTSTLMRLSLKYIIKDLKTSGAVILTISLSLILFTGLAYKAETLKTYREDTREMNYLNGEYALTMQYFDDVKAGIARENIEKISKLDGITSVKTSSGLPIRVLDESDVKRNDAYYNEYNKKLTELYGYGKAGYDGTDQVYNSMLLAYNEEAQKALRKYVVEGIFQEGLDANEVILQVARMDDTKKNNRPGFYKKGTPLMEYHAGDEITVKYRKDLKTSSVEYESLQDEGSEYIYKTYRIAAIVSFPYMYDCNRIQYPVLITSDKHLRELAPESGIQCLYCDADKTMDAAQKRALEQQLIRLSSQASNVSTRSLIGEIEQNDMFYHKQMVYIYGISIITFILVIINMINNIRYRMQKRTREVCMLRAIGMSIAMTKRIMVFENLLLGGVSVLLAFIFSWPVLGYIYKTSDMQAMGHTFQFAYVEFFLISFGALFVCGLLSLKTLETWKSGNIVEGVGIVE